MQWCKFAYNNFKLPLFTADVIDAGSGGDDASGSGSGSGDDWVEVNNPYNRVHGSSRDDIDFVNDNTNDNNAAAEPPYGVDGADDASVDIIPSGSTSIHACSMTSVAATVLLVTLVVSAAAGHVTTS